MSKIDKKEMTKLSKEHLEILRSFKSDGIPRDMDLSDDKQYEFIMHLRGGEEYMKTYFPHNHKLLQNSRNNPASKHMTLLEKVAAGMDVSDQWQDNIQIIGFVGQVLTANGNQYQISTTGLVGFVDGLEEMDATLQIYNTATGEIIASNTMENLLQNGYDTVITASGVTGSIDNIEAFLQVDYLEYNNGTKNTKIVQITLADKIDPSSPIQVDDPVHKAIRPNVGFIKVCMGRYDSDCDYSYTAQPAPQPPTPTIAVKGNVSFPGPITDPAAGGNTFGALFFVKRREGGATQLFTDYAQIYKYFKVNNNTNISWNFPPATFDKAPWNQGDMVDLNLTVQISVNGKPKNGQFQVTSLTGVPASKSVAKIDVLKFFWGCLSADSMITMSDNTQKRIDSIHAGEIIKNNLGKDLKVLDIATGKEEKPCLRIITQNKLSVLLTDEHPVCKANEFCFAKDLKIGDFIKTENGLDIIESITKESYTGTVYNLKLEGDENTGSAHFANGFLVGDGVMQGALLQQQKESKLKLDIKKLPKHWHFDAINSQRLMEGKPLVSIKSNTSKSIKA